MKPRGKLHIFGLKTVVTSQLRNKINEGETIRKISLGDIESDKKKLELKK